MLLRARHLVTMDRSPLEDGAVVVEQGRVLAVGPYREIRAEFPGLGCIDLGEQVLLPGLINAHCHLDYTGMRGAIPPQESFTRWIGCINASKRELREEDYLKAIEEGFAELKRWGTTTVCNLAAFPNLLPKLSPPPIRTWWFPEMLDLREPASDLVSTAIKAIGVVCNRAGWLGEYGLSPHAPYTASQELYGLCKEAAGQRGMALTTHIAESADEEEMFRDGAGELYSLLKRLGRSMNDCGHGSSFSNAVRSGLIGPGWLLTHANELEEADFELIASTSGWHFVHCPRSHRYFNHTPFPWQRLRELGATVSLGTDSLASNDDLSLFAELRAAQKSAPWLTSESLLETVTTQPAEALGKRGELGVIAPGAHADLIALPFAGTISEIYDALIANGGPIKWMMLDGKLC